MNRITTIEIAGKKYPLSFTLGASKEFIRRFGSLEKMTEIISDMNEVTEDIIDAIVTILEVLIMQGCAYLNTFEKDLPVREGLRHEEKYIALSREEIEIGLGVFDASKIAKAIFDCLNASNEKEIETESKNASAPKAL